MGLGNFELRFCPLAFLLAATLGIAGCSHENAESEDAPEAPRPVSVETVVREDIDRIVATDAVLFPVNQANVTPKISSPVKRMLVNRGDHVRAGQVVAELEAADLSAAAEETKQQYEQSEAMYQTLTGATVLEDQIKARSDLQAARQALEAARKVYENRLALQKEGALAQKLVDDAKVTMVQAQSQFDTAERHLQSLDQVSRRQAIRSAEAQMNAAKAHHDAAAVQLSYAQVRSPIDGIVADRPVYAGEMAQAGTPLLLIVDISQVVARANVPVKDAGLIRLGRPVRISGPDGDLAGVVTVVSPAVDPATTTVEVWAQAANPGGRMRPGSTVRVEVLADTLKNVLVAPVSALLNMEEGGQKVMVVGPDLVAHEHKIQAGVRHGSQVEIVSGVHEGDRVITSGGLGLEDNAKVRILPANAAAEKDEDDKTDEAGKEKSK